MNKTILRRLLVLLMLPLLLTGCESMDIDAPVREINYPDGIRVACVGDSITYGSGIDDRDADSYPAQLGRMLGDKWIVRNFGVSGATLLKKGDKPWWKQPAFDDATRFEPDVVIIKLGTNDSKPQNWVYRAEFARDYGALIDHFQYQPFMPRIWVCLPVPVYQDRWGINQAVVAGEIIPLVKQVGREKNVPVIDLYTPLSNKKEMFPDRIHPNAAGAAEMARVIYKALTGRVYGQPETRRTPAGKVY